jgi:hypothetical protein
MLRNTTPDVQMPADPPVSLRARLLQSLLVLGLAVLLSLVGLRLIVRASELPDWILTLIVLGVFLSLPLAAVILWLAARKRP